MKVLCCEWIYCRVVWRRRSSSFSLPGKANIVACMNFVLICIYSCLCSFFIKSPSLQFTVSEKERHLSELSWGWFAVSFGVRFLMFHTLLSFLQYACILEPRPPAQWAARNTAPVCIQIFLAMSSKHYCIQIFLTLSSKKLLSCLHSDSPYIEQQEITGPACIQIFFTPSSKKLLVLPTFRYSLKWAARYY